MPAKAKCCSKRSVKLKKANFAKATAAANAPLGPEGRFAKPKKASAKKAPSKSAKPCRVCGKK